MAHLKTLSRILRTNQTEAEKKLWHHLRRKQFYGLRFRRQVPIDRFIADFVCYEKRLVIELDGGQHSIMQEQDIERTKIIESNGFKVIRYWNNDVFDNIDGVLEDLTTMIHPHPNPPPHGEGIGGI